ncbi:hypothetical protein [Pseudonocardia sp. H11422]|uniref:hypothetical protein n=1 Tax=Pseudonocardia sp. H11422 TaxID=2835866 RepID=UPI001BDD60EC|nr:hypothetical protein [Pseudonocardia sp. H11422]
MTTLFAMFAGLAAAAALCCLQLVHVRRVRCERRQLFADVAHLLGDSQLHPDGLGYPVLTGTYRGHPVRLRPIVDTVTLRKLPSLWLLVTQQRRLDVGAPLDVLVRPSGWEFFSPNATFGHELEAPAGFPSHVRIASPAPTGAPAPVLAQLGPLVRDPRTKEVLVGAGGVRVTRQLAEGAQSPYRSTRRADFGHVRIVPEDLRGLLDTMTGIGDALAGAGVTHT